ncbi:unnamed protein product [Adineta steineri]|uniref:SCP domain-containing protein n=1 Tax=Adineta steineri TaxID=433720 RepID=A0A814WKI9_9BILA|nr:unnamed protein product [Adineta steineri]CAF3606176.1 unnamed protein product [Adineta steineri]
MDIQSFSATYWYIWLLVVLVILILILLNGGGILLYRKNRQKFIKEANQVNDNNIPMRAPSTISTINMNNKPNYRKMSILSAVTRNSSVTNSKVYPELNTRKSRRMINSLPNITTINKVLRTSQVKPLSPVSDDMNEKADEMDLSLEEFQRQALAEHNFMRAMYNKPALKLTESLNIYAQYWAEQCARTNIIKQSRPEWRLQCNGQSLGENIISIKSLQPFDGSYFTSLLMAKGNQSKEVDCILNEVSTEVGFGRAQTQPNDDTQQVQWIGVAHYYPYRQLTAVQS